MGVLNVTPDSFSDGGQFTQLDLALDHAEQMISQGAAIIDVGGESTRPGASSVSTQQELDRVIPVIEKIAANLDCVISLDSSCPQVMEAAAQAGASLLNDVRAFQREGALQVAAKTGLPVCLMHMRGEPKTMQQQPHYDSVVEEVQAFLLARVEACLAAGIERNKIIIDPGFGFGKTLDHNLQLLEALAQLKVLGLPILVGMSRKSMIGAILNNDTSERLYGGLALAAIAVRQGANIVRTHDVGPTSDAVAVAYAVSAPEK
ncbi:MAG: dihydropteroate synthase [Cellvibrionales bacterium]|nr:dihydropteroate synthase [Cellvibrionales bacterium]